MAEEQPILFEIIDKVGKITLNRPDKYNSFNQAMALLLQEKLDECKNNTEIRAVYLTGSGKAFSAGQDIEEMTGENKRSLSQILNEHLNPIIKKIFNLEKPVVGAVNGVAAGAGASIALACDITVAADTATFIQAFTKIGLVPDSGSTFILPRLIGLQRASALMMLGESISGKQAANMGMIYQCYSNRSFDKLAFQLAQRLATMPTKALSLTKQALSYSIESTIDKQLEIEVQLQDKANRTEDFKEGINAFLEKRTPNFKGR